VVWVGRDRLVLVVQRVFMGMEKVWVGVEMVWVMMEGAWVMMEGDWEMMEGVWVEMIQNFTKVVGMLRIFRKKVKEMVSCWMEFFCLLTFLMI
jgi:hypothetical protein